jgi:hypothetical protein
MMRRTILDDISSILFVTIGVRNIGLDEIFYFGTIAGQRALRLCGLICFEQLSEEMGHFTCTYLDKEGNMWYYDGITTRRNLIYEGQLNARPRLSLHQRRPGQWLSAAIYAQC